MDQKQNSIVIDLTNDSDTEEETKNDTLKSSFGDIKDTSSRLEHRATRSETQAEGGVKQLNATKLKEHESLRQQNGESQMKETHLIDDDDSKSLPKAFPAYKGKLLKQKGSIEIKKKGERCFCGRNDSKLLSISNRFTRVVNKIKKPLNMKFALEQINKTNNIQVPNTDVNKPIRLNNGATMKANKLFSKVKSKTFHSTHSMSHQPIEWNMPSGPLLTSLQRSRNTMPIIRTTQGTPTPSKLLEAPANPYISSPPQSTQKNKLSKVGTEKLVNTSRKENSRSTSLNRVRGDNVTTLRSFNQINKSDLSASKKQISKTPVSAIKNGSKANSRVVNLLSDSETDEDTNNTTLKSSFGDKKDTSSRLEPRATRSEIQAEGGVKQLNATKLSDGRKECESLRQQNWESLKEKIHLNFYDLVDIDEIQVEPLSSVQDEIQPQTPTKMKRSSLQRLRLSNTGDNLLTNNKVNSKGTSYKMSEKVSLHPEYKCDSKLMSISNRSKRVVNKIKKPLNMKFASEQINKTNNIQMSNTDVNKPIRLNNSSLNVVKSIDSSCSDEVIVIDDDIIINEENRTTMKAKELLSKVESITFPSTVSSNSKSTTLQLDEKINKNDKTPWNMFGKTQNILDTTKKQSLQVGVTKSKTNSNINESNNEFIKELDFDFDQSIFQTSLSELFNGVEEFFEMCSFDNEELNSLIECDLLDSNETEKRIDTVGVDQGDSSVSESNSTIGAFDTFAQITRVRQKSFTSKDIKDTKESKTTNQVVNHLKQNCHQSEEIYDDQSSTVSVTGIPVLQGAINAASIKQIINISQKDIVLPPNTKIATLIADNVEEKKKKEEEERKNKEDNERKKREENERRIKELQEKMKIEEEQKRRANKNNENSAYYNEFNKVKEPGNYRSFGHPENYGVVPSVHFKKNNEHVENDTNIEQELIESRKVLTNDVFETFYLREIRKMKCIGSEGKTSKEIETNSAEVKMITRTRELKVEEKLKESYVSKNVSIKQRPQIKSSGSSSSSASPTSFENPSVPSYEYKKQTSNSDDYSKRNTTSNTLYANKNNRDINIDPSDIARKENLNREVIGIIPRTRTRSSSFKQKIISETTSSKQDQDNSAAIIPKETVGTKTIVSTSIHPDHQTTRSKSPLKTIFNKHTLNDKNCGKTLIIPVVMLSTSQIPLHKVYQRSVNNLIKQQEIKPTHDRILKQIVTTTQLDKPPKKRGRKRRIEVQNEKQESNNRNKTSQNVAKSNTSMKEAETPAKRTRMSLRPGGCKNDSMNNRNKTFPNVAKSNTSIKDVEPPAKRTRRSLGLRGCKNDAMNNYAQPRTTTVEPRQYKKQFVEM